jgi:hypothetical protein
MDSENGPNYGAACGMCNRYVPGANLKNKKKLKIKITLNLTKSNHSALLTLHNPFFLPHSASTFPLSANSHDLVMCKRTADRVYELGIIFFSNIDYPGLLGSLAPLVPDSIYQTAVFYAHLSKGADKQRQTEHYQSFVDAYELMRRALAYFDKRWKVAGMLLRFRQCN